jgi:hypothetical protein
MVRKTHKHSASLQKYISDLERLKLLANQFDIYSKKSINSALASAKRLNEKLKSTKETRLDIEMHTLEIQIVMGWQYLIKDLAERQLNVIEEQETNRSSQDFTKIRQTLNKILEDIEDRDQPFKYYEKFYYDVESLTEAIQGKISADDNLMEKIKEEFNKGFSEGQKKGFITGIITSIVGGILLAIIFWAASLFI